MAARGAGPAALPLPARGALAAALGGAGGPAAVSLPGAREAREGGRGERVRAGCPRGGGRCSSRLSRPARRMNRALCTGGRGPGPCVPLPRSPPWPRGGTALRPRSRGGGRGGTRGAGRWPPSPADQTALVVEAWRPGRPRAPRGRPRPGLSSLASGPRAGPGAASSRRVSPWESGSASALPALGKPGVRRAPGPSAPASSRALSVRPRAELLVAGGGHVRGMGRPRVFLAPARHRLLAQGHRLTRPELCRRPRASPDAEPPPQPAAVKHRDRCGRREPPRPHCCPHRSPTAASLWPALGIQPVASRQGWAGAAGLAVSSQLGTCLDPDAEAPRERGRPGEPLGRHKEPQVDPRDGHGQAAVVHSSTSRQGPGPRPRHRAGHPGKAPASLPPEAPALPGWYKWEAARPAQGHSLFVIAGAAATAATPDRQMEAPARGGPSLEAGPGAQAAGAGLGTQQPPASRPPPQEGLVELPSSFSELLAFFCSNATIHGAIRLVCSSRNRLKTAVWGLLFLGALGALYCQFALLFADYWHRPVLMTVAVRSERKLFPAVTLCDLNPLRPGPLRRQLEALDEFAQENLRSLHRLDLGQRRQPRAAAPPLDEETLPTPFPHGNSTLGPPGKLQPVDPWPAPRSTRDVGVPGGAPRLWAPQANSGEEKLVLSALHSKSGE
ncbi:amiloride-sensitive sodium channel subunit delta [Choloepus didactylus]|uniref:amiloride-sensitive sodium channel subunit delta n=1 Tax=Choloepus didactylus TaxID=27675 RepID=UPI0018A0330A|nr:amiloride-sensitive sodium channel subunit delta [Choloepus didactylus]